MQLPAYERDPYLTELLAEVVRVGHEGSRPFAVLSDSVLYPEGGGQPADRGWIGTAGVLDVKRVGDEVRHFVDAPPNLGPSRVVLDWARRFDHMQQHTGQHLLSAVAQDRFSWVTTAFHLGDSTCDIELAVTALSEGQILNLEEAVAKEIRAARPVRVRLVTAEEFGALAVRTRGLPEDHRGDVRLIEIEGIDLNTCCGTHLRSTAEIEVVKLLSTESLRGGVRLTFVAGGRARVRLGRFEVQNAALRAALGAPDEGLVEAARDRVARLVHSERRVRSLLAELAEASADALGEGSAALVSGHWEGKDGAFLSAVAKRFVERHPGRAAFLTATEGERLSAVIVAGEGFPVEPVDWQSAGRDAMALLGGRGGGTGRLFQGKAPVQKSAAAAREAALERMRRLV